LRLGVKFLLFAVELRHAIFSRFVVFIARFCNKKTGENSQSEGAYIATKFCTK
jgi:hypothetical protein